MSVAENLKHIKKAAGSAMLVAVSKQQPEGNVRAVLEAGHRVFGENRVQEATQRWPSLKREYPDIKLHLIGPLQTNKAADAVALFDVIETVDREKLARVLSEEMKRQDRKIPCLIQVNTGDEEQKSGVSIGDFPALLSFCRVECGLDIHGLMCIPPAAENPQPHFALLAGLARDHGLAELSMGMSGDFEIAIAQGATIIRLGSALFGERI